MPINQNFDGEDLPGDRNTCMVTEIRNVGVAHIIPFALGTSINPEEKYSIATIWTNIYR